MRLALPRWALHPRPLWLWLWRHMEREAGRNVPETFGSPGYNNGKVTGLTPDLTVMTETTESPYVCCGYCAAGMACLTARTGLTDTMNKTAHPIRSSGGRPHNNGAYASELRNGAMAAWGVKLKAIAISEIKDELRAGHAVVVNLDYAELPAWLKVQSGSFGHSVCLFGFVEKEGAENDLVGFFDPLWPQDGRGAWAKYSAIKPAFWGDGEHSTTVVTLEAETMSGAFTTFNPQAQSLKVGDIAEDTSFYSDVELKTRLGSWGGDKTEQLFGQMGGAYAVQKMTGVPYPDGVARETMVFVAKGSVNNIRDLPPPSTGCTDEQLLTARREGYDLALSPFPPRP